MSKLAQRQKIRYRIRKKVQGTASKPRLSVFRSNAEIYCQLIDDDNGVTLAAASSAEKDIAAQKVAKIEKAKLAGQSIAKKQQHYQSLHVYLIEVVTYTTVESKQ